MRRNKKEIHIAYGELQVAGECIGLYHARATYTDDGGLRVVVSDQSLPSCEPAVLFAAAKSGERHAIQFNIAPDARSAAVTIWSNRVSLHTTIRQLGPRTLQPLAKGVLAGVFPACEDTIGGIPFCYRVQFAAEIDPVFTVRAA